MSIGTGMDSGASKAMRAKPGPAKDRPPVLVGAPALSGTGRIGAMMTVDPGVWSGTPAPALALQWQIGDADVPGATGASHTPVPADDLKRLRCVVTASNASGSVTAATAAVGVAWAAPSATGGLAAQVFDLGGGIRTVDAAAAFAGGGLSFGVTGAGATIDAATGIVSIATATARSAEPVTVTAANSGGTVAVTFDVTVRAAPAAPVLVGAPALSGTGRIGAMMTVDPGVWSGTPAPALALQWQIGDADVPGATGASHTPVPADDLKRLRCVVTASNASGSVTAATAAVGVAWAAPSATGGLAAQVFDLGGGIRTVDAAAAFAGGGLSFGVTGAGATIDAATGIVSIATATARSAEPVTVTAANSGGTVAVTFDVTVRAAPAAPVLSGVTADSAASPPSLSWTVDQPGTTWWALSGAAYATGAQVEAHSGAAANGSFDNTAGLIIRDVDLSRVPPGRYILSLAVKSVAGVYSNVENSSVTITEAAAPAIVFSSPAGGAAGVAATAKVMATFDSEIVLDAGNIVLRRNDGGWTDVETFDAASGIGTGGGTVSASGAVLTIAPGAALEGSKEHAIRIAPTAVRGPAGTAFVGIADDVTLSFTTAAAAAYVPQWVEFAKGDGSARLSTNSDFGFPASIDSYTLVYAFEPTQFSTGSLLLTPTTSAHYLTQIEIGAAGKPDIRVQDSASAQKGRVYTGHALTLGTKYLMLVSMDRQIRSSVALVSLETGAAIKLPTSVNTADFPMANPFNPNSPAGWSVPNAANPGVRLERVALWLGTYVDVNDSGVQGLFHESGTLKSPDVARVALGAEDIGLYDGELVTGRGTAGTFTPVVSGSGSITAV